MSFPFRLITFFITIWFSVGEMDFNNIGMTAKGIFHSLDSIFEVFKRPENMNIPQVISLISVFERCCDFINMEKYNKQYRRQVFIVIEGLQASGSRYFANRLVRLINGKYLNSPPNCLLPFRLFFDKQHLELRSAFYALGNYIIAEQVKREYLHRPVIINRYWHSQAAVALSHQAQNGSMLPLRISSIYKWPKDLLMPDSVFLLTRQYDIHNPVWNEKRLVMSRYFRSLMVEAYLRMNQPSLIDIDGGQYQTRTYATLRMLIHNADTNLMECYKKYNVCEHSPTDQNQRPKFKYIF